MTTLPGFASIWDDGLYSRIWPPRRGRATPTESFGRASSSARWKDLRGQSGSRPIALLFEPNGSAHALARCPSKSQWMDRGAIRGLRRGIVKRPARPRAAGSNRLCDGTHGYRVRVPVAAASNDRIERIMRLAEIPLTLYRELLEAPDAVGDRAASPPVRCERPLTEHIERREAEEISAAFGSLPTSGHRG